MQKAYSYLRFSTLEQKKGDSFRRQFEDTKKYAEIKNWKLQEQSFRDLGLSGFTSENLERGSLGEFVKLVEENKIESNSILIVENWDRLSRAPIQKQFNLFQRLLNLGILIAVVTDDKLFGQDCDYSDFMYVLSNMERSYRESQRKSVTIGKAWEDKRATKKILTSIAPAWLVFEKSNNIFVPIPERVKVLREIFELSAKGFGKGTIAKRLNQRGENVWGKGKKRGVGWHNSYIQKILDNRAVLGEFQPHKMHEGKRIPCGPALPNYFPKVLDDSLFIAAKNARNAARNCKGRMDGWISNIFQSLLVCGYSGGSVVYVNKGSRCRYLVSDQARRGLEGQYISWLYDDFELTFLEFVTELNFENLISKESDLELKILNEKMENLRFSESELTKKINNLMTLGLHANVEHIPEFQEQFKLFGEQRSLARKEISNLAGQIQAKQAIRRSFFEGNARFKELCQKRHFTEERFELRKEIRSKIKKIEVFGGGFFWSKKNYDEIIWENRENPERVEKAILEAPFLPDWVKRRAHDFRDSIANGILREWDNSWLKGDEPRKKERYFIVHFLNGFKKLVMPQPQFPTGHYQIVSVSPEGVVEYSGATGKSGQSLGLSSFGVKWIPAEDSSAKSDSVKTID